MPRRSLIEKFLRDEQQEDRGEFLVVYDFKNSGSGGIPQRFYINLKRLIKTGRCQTLQKSVLLCLDLKAAKAAARLARHYGATVAIFHVLRKMV